MDEELPPRTEFYRHNYELSGEKLEGYFRDSMAVLKELYGRPEFANSLVFAPEKQYKIKVKDGQKKAIRVHSDMHTGQWWCSIQVCHLF